MRSAQSVVSNTFPLIMKLLSHQRWKDWLQSGHIPPTQDLKNAYCTNRWQSHWGHSDDQNPIFLAAEHMVPWVTFQWVTAQQVAHARQKNVSISISFSFPVGMPGHWLSLGSAFDYLFYWMFTLINPTVLFCHPSGFHLPQVRGAQLWSWIAGVQYSLIVWLLRHLKVESGVFNPEKHQSILDSNPAAPELSMPIQERKQ